MARIISAFEQFFTVGQAVPFTDENGTEILVQGAVPLVNGQIDFFETGSSTLRKTIYADEQETIPNPNPLIINGDGRVPNVFGTGSYRIVVKDANGLQIIERDPVGGDLTLGFGANWVSTISYSQGTVVFDDGRYWVSLTDNNLNNRPSTDGGVNWSVVALEDTGQIAENTTAIAELQATNFFRKNVLINGNFDFWQRGTTQPTSVFAYGSSDRWTHANIASTRTHSREDFAPGQTEVLNNPTYFARTDVTTAGTANAFVYMRQAIEGVRTLAGETVTLSFWAKADTNKNMVSVFEQYFGSGGTTSARVTGIGATTHALTTSWQKFTSTIVIPPITGTSIGTNRTDFLGVMFWFDAGSDFDDITGGLGNQSGIFDIAQVQVEKGSTATDFEEIPPAVELALCQRYYEKSYDVDVPPGAITNNGRIAERDTRNAATVVPGTWFKVTKRAVPAITIYSSVTGAEDQVANAGDKTVTAIEGLGENSFSGVVIAAGVTNDNAVYHYTANCDL